MSPTQITVLATTDVVCAQVSTNGTAFYSGDPKAEAPIASTRACAAQGARNEIGTLVLTPSGDDDERIDVAVVLGVDVRSEECAARDYRGCIVAKRRVRYVPHEPLDMPIELALSCKDVACDPDETCFRGGCVSAEVVAKDGCLGPECDAPSVDGGTVTDAASVDAVADSGATSDAPASIDATVSLNKFTPTSGVPRGVHVLGGEVWWTESGTTATAVYSMLKGQSPRSRFPPLSGEHYGILARSSLYVELARWGDPNICGQVISGAQYQCAAGPGMVGVARYDTSTDAGVLTFFSGPSATYTFLPDGGTRTGGPSSGYAEGLGANISYVDSDRIVEIDGLSGLRKANDVVVPTGGRALRGIAASTTSWFVSTAAGTIFRVDRVTKQSTVLSQGALTSVEDLAYDPDTNALYIAAMGDTPGIYMLTPP